MDVSTMLTLPFHTPVSRFIPYETRMKHSSRTADADGRQLRYIYIYIYNIIYIYIYILELHSAYPCTFLCCSVIGLLGSLVGLAWVALILVGLN